MKTNGKTDEKANVVVTPEGVSVRLGSRVGRPVEIRTKDGNVQYKCEYCGKWLSSVTSIENEAGGYCEHLRDELGFDEKGLAELRLSRTVETVPTNAKGESWVKVAVVDRLCKKRGIAISKLVKAFGGDRGIEPALRPEFQFVYCGRARWVDPWCATDEGLDWLAGISDNSTANALTNGKKSVVKEEASAS